MSYQFNGKGFLQMTGKQARAQAQPQIISSNHTNGFGLTASQMSALNSVSLSPLTISGLTPTSGFNNISLNSVFPVHDYFKKYEIVESTEDILLLSCVWYRMRNSEDRSKVIFPDKLLDTVLYKHITEEDRELASTIRDYYSKKIMMWKLKSVELTKFREDLNTFVHSDGLKFEEKVCGLVYRLPEFYHYDVAFDQMVIDCNKTATKHTLSISSHKLKHVGTLRVNKKLSKRVEYWFKTESDVLTKIIVTPDNPLIKVWDKLATSGISLEGKFLVRERDGVPYYEVRDYSLI